MDIAEKMTVRDTIVNCARQHVLNRTPYQWGGGHHGPSWGLDCSGLILDCVRSAGIDPGFWNSTMMREKLPPIDTPKPGDVAVYLPHHVVMVESFDSSTGIATIIGENGGGPSTTSLEIALKQDARAKREPTHLYRDGFAGFRSIGADDEFDAIRSSSSSAPWLLIAGAATLVGLFVWSIKGNK